MVKKSQNLVNAVKECPLFNIIFIKLLRIFTEILLCLVYFFLQQTSARSTYFYIRGVARGWAGGPEPSRNLADQLTLFKTRGADYSRHTTASPPPPIQNAIYTSVHIKVTWEKNIEIEISLSS